MDTPREEPLPESQREAMRARLVEDAQREGYSPWLHLFGPASFGLLVIGAAIGMLRDLQLIELLTVPLVFVLSNATEWRAHRDLLHKRVKPLQILYDRHTPQHHMLFMTDDMAVRSRLEWRLVLIPGYAFLLIGAANLPVATLLYLVISPNVGALYLASALAYVIAYEWLHLSFHLHPESVIGRLWLVKFLRRHHATHHDPRLMQRYNFNVVVPLWDLVRGTYLAASARGEAVVRPRHGH